MKSLLLFFFLLSVSLRAALPIEVYFSPSGGCTGAVVQAVDSARSQIRMQAYSFTSSPIASALVRAEKRGVDVQAILDKSNFTAKYSASTFLTHAGIPVYVDPVRGIAHSKVMVIDGQTVVTGSFNFTKAAEESNVENLLVIHDADIAKQYLGDWQARRAVSSAPGN